MNEMKIWAAGLCAALIGSAAIELIVPEGSFKKTYSFVVSAAVILIMLLPIGKLSDVFGEIRSLHNFDAEVYDYTASVNESILSGVNENLEEAAARELYEAGLPYKNIEAITDIDEDGSIVINRIEVICDEFYREDVKEILERKLQIQTEVADDENEGR